MERVDGLDGGAGGLGGFFGAFSHDDKEEDSSYNPPESSRGLFLAAARAGVGIAGTVISAVGTFWHKGRWFGWNSVKWRWRKQLDR